MTEKILLVGGGGHCKAVLDSLFSLGTYTVAIIDKKNNNNSVLGVPVIGCDNDLHKLQIQGYRKAFVSLGSIENPGKRSDLFKLLMKLGYLIPNIFDPSATISVNSKIDMGVYVGKNVVINAGVKIGKGVIINSGAIIEHDCEIGDFVHVASGSTLCGGVQIGTKTHVGAGSVVRQNIKIGSNTIIGLGSVVINDIGDNITAYGTPCQERTR